MPDPTRQQFDAAYKKVVTSAPPGLSKEDFYALVDKELATATYTPDPRSVEYIKRAMGIIPEGTGEGGLVARTAQSLRSIAQPQTIGDFLQLVIPSGIPNIPFKQIASQTGKAVGDAARDVVGNTRSLGSALTAPVRFAGKTLGNMKRQLSDPRPWDTINDLPLYKQMEQLPETAAPATTRAPGPTASGRETQSSKVLPTVRKASSGGTLEDRIKKVLAEGMAETPKPGMTTLPPEPGMTPGGAFSQSGKFPKSEQVGQARGYSSGRPATPTPPAAVSPGAPAGRAAKDIVERRVNPSGELPPGMTDRRMDDLLQQFGGTASDRGGVAADVGPLMPDVQAPPSAARDAFNAGSRSGELSAETQRMHEAVLQQGKDLQDSLRRQSPANQVFGNIDETTQPGSWHSGAEAGSAEAKQARSLHQYEGEMDSGYRRNVDGDIPRLTVEDLMALLRGNR